MTWAEITMWAAAVSAIVAARFNATALALVFAYFVVQAWYFAGETDILHQPGILFMIDIAVVVFVFTKTIIRCGDEKLTRCVAYITLGDRAILALFMFGTWPAYVANVSDFSRWYALWAIAVLQFVIADYEAFHEWRQAKALSNDPGAPSSGSLRAAWAGGGQWST